jgi:hypothetical protein
MCPSLKLGWRRSIDRTAAIAGKEVGSMGVSASAEIGANWHQQRISEMARSESVKLIDVAPVLCGHQCRWRGPFRVHTSRGG